MHELALGKALLELIEQHAPSSGHIESIQLKIGQLSHANLEALRFNFQVMAQGSRAERARLEIMQEPGQAECTQCAHVFNITHYGQACPHCQTHFIRITQGESLQLISLTMVPEP